MSLPLIFRCAVVLITTFAVFPHPTRLHADEKGVTVHRPHDSPAAQKILKALQQPTVIEFTETPLQDVVLYLKDFHHIEIQLDQKALEDAGLAPDVPVTRNLQGIALESALRLLLKTYDLTYVIDNEVLTITTVAADNARGEIRVYNIAGLIQGARRRSLRKSSCRASPRPDRLRGNTFHLPSFPIANCSSCGTRSRAIAR